MKCRQRLGRRRRSSVANRRARRTAAIRRWSFELSSPRARREPEKTLLHDTVPGHLKTFLVELEQDGGGLPRYVLRRIEGRVRALLKPRLDALREDARPPDPLAASQAESVTALRGKPPDRSESNRLVAHRQGFSLHPGGHLHENNRQGLAQLWGYGARPPLTQERLSALPDGKLAYRMKRRLGDGRKVLILEPRDLLRRLATLVQQSPH